MANIGLCVPSEMGLKGRLAPARTNFVTHANGKNTIIQQYGSHRLESIIIGGQAYRRRSVSVEH